MKNRHEIQRAHDILHFLGTEEAPALFRADAHPAVHAAHDVLAWVLGFPCGETFQDNLDTILSELRAKGYVEIDKGRPS